MFSGWDHFYLCVIRDQRTKRGQQTGSQDYSCSSLEASDIQRFELASRATKRDPELGRTTFSANQLYDRMRSWPSTKGLALKSPASENCGFCGGRTGIWRLATSCMGCTFCIFRRESTLALLRGSCGVHRFCHYRLLVG